MKKKFSVCIIGCGNIFNNHAVSLLALDNVEISALCDIDGERAARKRSEHSLTCPIYDDYIRMLDEIKPDAVHILTPHHLHAEMTLEALKRDIFVFLEKPMCIKEYDIQKLLIAEENSRASVCVSFQNRFNEATLMAKKAADDDGGALRGFGTVIWNRDDAYYSAGAWRGKYATEGGGVMINQAIHTLDLLCFFLGIPKKVQSICSNMRHRDSIEVEDSCESIIDFDGGRVANVFATTCYSGHDSTTLRIETKNHVIEIRDADLYLDGEHIQIEKPDAYIGKKCYGSSHLILIEKFYRAISEGDRMPVTLTEAQNAVRIILAAYDSNSKIIDLKY